MTIPSFLEASPLVLAPGPAADATGIAAEAIINIAVQKQQQTRWCWAAVTVSVERYYDPTITQTQCGFANLALKRQDCCSANPAPCNMDWYLSRALTITGNLQKMTESPLAFADVQTEISNKAAACLRIAWTGGGAHFVVITGWMVAADGTEYLDIANPNWIATQVAYDDFPAGYRAGGTWTNSYLTAPATAAAGARPSTPSEA